MKTTPARRPSALNGPKAMLSAPRTWLRGERWSSRSWVRTSLSANKGCEFRPAASAGLRAEPASQLVGPRGLAGDDPSAVGHAPGESALHAAERPGGVGEQQEVLDPGPLVAVAGDAGEPAHAR